MKNEQIKSQKPTKVGLKATLKQAAQKSDSRAERNDSRKPTLRFGPTAWAKLLYFRDKSGSEVGGFGITEPDDLLFVTEFVTVKQDVTAVSVKFDDEAVADLFDAQVDLGRKPEQFARIWLHSHPGSSPEPSGTDEETFARVFGSCQWAVLFVVARNNKTYARLRFNVGPGGQILTPVAVDYSHDFGPSDHERWDAEYAVNVKATEWLTGRTAQDNIAGDHEVTDCALPYDILDEFERMEPAERQFVLDELAARPELWDQETEVMCL